jgi:hypothetical protein
MFKYKNYIFVCYIFIKTISALKSGKRPPKCKNDPSPFDEDAVVILGGGASGNTAAEKLREVYIG